MYYPEDWQILQERYGNKKKNEDYQFHLEEAASSPKKNKEIEEDVSISGFEEIKL